MPSYSDVLRHTQGLAGDTQAEIAAVAAVVADLAVSKAEAVAAWAKAREALAAVYLRELSAAAIGACERHSGFRGFTRFDPIKAKAKEQARLEAKIARTRANETYVRRTYLVGPNGSITARLDEAKGLLDPWERECATFEALAGFKDLWDSGYDTPEYPNRWWEPVYWRRWSQGDAICTALGLADFGDDVRPAYGRVDAERARWRKQVAAIQADYDGVHELVRQHDADVARLADLDAIYLGEARTAVATYLEGVDEPLLEGWADGDRGVISLLRTCAGLKAKVEYLGRLADTTEASRQDLQVRANGYQAKLAKLNRPKAPYKTYSDRDIAPKGRLVLDKSRIRREKALGMRDRITRYDDYDRFSLANDPALWWFAMTARPPGPWHPGLADWYARHPEVVVIHDHDDEPGVHPGVAAAMEDHDLDSLGDVS